MTYYYRGYRGRRYWGSYHVSKRRQLTNLFGGIDQDIERAFFALPSFVLDALFIEYGRHHGKSAEAYARRTYPQWKSSTVKLSGQTAERLLELLPPRLSKEQRYELIRKLRKHYLKKTSEHVTTPPETWRQHVVPAVEKVIMGSRDFKLPQELFEKATWLTDGDTQAAHRILHSIEEEEARQRTAYLDAEFKRIEIFVANVKNTDLASHTISIPQGDIFVTIQKEKPTLLKLIFGLGRTTMSGNSHELVPRDQLQKALALQQSRGNLLNLTLDDLSENQKIELRKKILEEQIGLDVSQAKAEQRFHNSTRDMASTVQAVRNLEQSSKSDYEVRSTFETASGNTNITVKKSNSTVIIVVAIVIGIVLFLLLSK
jgi:hypothetical protein